MKESLARKEEEEEGREEGTEPVKMTFSMNFITPWER